MKQTGTIRRIMCVLLATALVINRAPSGISAHAEEYSSVSDHGLDLPGEMETEAVEPDADAGESEAEAVESEIPESGAGESEESQADTEESESEVSQESEEESEPELPMESESEPGTPGESAGESEPELPQETTEAVESTNASETTESVETTETAVTPESSETTETIETTGGTAQPESTSAAESTSGSKNIVDMLIDVVTGNSSKNSGGGKLSATSPAASSAISGGSLASPSSFTTSLATPSSLTGPASLATPASQATPSTLAMKPMLLSLDGYHVSTAEAFIAAIADSSVGDTIVLDEDIYIDRSTKQKLKITRDITIDFNGCTLSGGGAVYGAAYTDYGMCTVNSGCTLTLVDADITTTRSKYKNSYYLEDFIYNNKGTVIIDSARDISARYFIYKNYGTVTISDGNFNVTEALVYYNGDKNNKSAAITIESGTYHSDSFIICTQYGSVTIHSGEFSSDNDCFRVSGGTFSMENSTVSSTSYRSIYVSGGSAELSSSTLTGRNDAIYKSAGTCTFHAGVTATITTTDDADGALCSNNGWTVATDTVAIPSDWETSKPSKVMFVPANMTVEFYSEGDLYKSQTGNITLMTFPDDPVSSMGYSFCYWEDADGNKVDDLSEIISDAQLYAVFSDKQYTVSFDDNGTVTTQMVNVNTPIGEVPGVGRTEAGDMFMYWKLGDDVVNTETTTPVDRNITLKAMYRRVVMNYEELKAALALKIDGIILGDDITVEGMLTVDYSCEIQGEGHGLIRPDGFTGKLLNVKNASAAEAVILTLTDAVIDGRNISGADSAVYATNNTQIAFTGVTVKNNNASSKKGGGICLEGADAVLTDCIISNNRGSEGGGIYATAGWGSSGTHSVTLKGCTVNKNVASSDGGGIYTYEDVKLLVEESVIDDNQGTCGGGIFCASDNIDLPLIIRDSKIRRNKASTRGGGIETEKTIVDLYGDTTISGNSSKDGGGIHSNWGGSADNIIYMHDRSSISHNTATQDGGGVCCDELLLVMYDDSSIDHNTATKDGGGVYAGSYGMRQEGGTIRDNRAGGSGGGVYLKQQSTLTAGTMFDNLADNMGDDLYNAGGLRTVYSTQPSRYFGDGDSDALKTVIAERIEGYYDIPSGVISVPWLGWFVDGLDSGTSDLYTDVYTATKVCEENANLGLLSGDEYSGLKAIWYGLVLAYDANYEGSTDHEYDSTAYVSGSDATVRDNMFTRSGYEFKGWNTAKDGSGDSYSKDEALTMTKSQVLYAQWEKILDPDGTGGDDPADKPKDDPADDPKDDPADDPKDDPADDPKDDPKDDPANDPKDDPKNDTDDGDDDPGSGSGGGNGGGSGGGHGGKPDPKNGPGVTPNPDTETKVPETITVVVQRDPGQNLHESGYENPETGDTRNLPLFAGLMGLFSVLLVFLISKRDSRD